MDDVETIIEALHILYTRLETLRNIEGPEVLLAEKIQAYRSTLEEACAAYGKIETVVDELGQELDYPHTRLDQEVKKYGVEKR